MTNSDDEQILLRLSTGKATPILVADFQAMSMAPRLSEMLSERVTGQSVFQIDPVRVLSGNRRYVPLPALAAACADEFDRAGMADGPVIVVGHCSAAPLALRAARLLAASRPTTAVLVNPTWPTDEHVATKFSEFLGKFGPAGRSCPELDGDPDLVVAAMERLFSDEMTALAARRGVAASAGAFADLLVWYRGWLAFLLAGRNDAGAQQAAGTAAVTVLSDSPATVTVPGLRAGDYRVWELSPQPVGSVSSELADVVVGHVKAGLACRARR